ncbi:MAG: D-alanyl-D-alanine carboxypeptidase/D-alanyl-D-alanine-endopeptidase [Gemmatimonadetes bacterium]|nr:D-alanyl-D-alanine carboxypeptidase/D-alanyl-D-alanine-endopeptidase [Gemmatimonadota bacterium]
MRAARTLLVLTALVQTGCASRGVVAPPLAPSLATVIDSITTRPPLHRTVWGILVQDAESGRVLYAQNREKHFIPASNTKLVVGVAALGLFGPEYRYRTPLLLGGRSADSAATLIVVGSGDPTWSARFHDDVSVPIDSMATLVAASGVRTIGTLILDVSRFRDALVNGTWEVADLPGIYAPPIDAVAAADGTFDLVVTGGSRAGEPAMAMPAGPVTQPVSADLVTDTAGARTVLRIDYTARRDSIYITGSVGAGAVDTVTRSVTQPALSFGGALVTMLNRRGVWVDSVMMVRDSAAAAAYRDNSTVVAEWVSAPMREIVAVILRPSQNWVAEQVLKSIGAEFGEEGSWSGGIDVAYDYLHTVAGVDSGAVNLRDASGMSPQNLLSPEATIQMLLHARAQPWSDSFRDALAAPGLQGSTLSGRLRSLDGRMFAKTGTISNVNALSGYIIGRGGRDYVFSILTNGTGLPAGMVRDAMDEVALAMARAVDEEAGY